MSDPNHKTFGPPTLRTGDGDPNGSVPAFKGSLFVNRNVASLNPPELWQNTDGATAWTKLYPQMALLHHITVGDILIYHATADPNGVDSASKGSLAADSTNAKLYINLDGAMAWAEVSGGAAAPAFITAFPDLASLVLAIALSMSPPGGSAFPGSGAFSGGIPAAGLPSLGVLAATFQNMGGAVLSPGALAFAGGSPSGGALLSSPVAAAGINLSPGSPFGSPVSAALINLSSADYEIV